MPKSNLTRNDYLKLIRSKKVKKKVMRRKKMIESDMVRSLPVLQALASEFTPKKQKRSIASTMNKAQMNGVNEIVHNFLNKNIKINPVELKKLRRYKNTIRKFSSLRNSLPQQKEYLQKGGFFPVLSSLIPIALKTVGPLLGKLFG